MFQDAFSARLVLIRCFKLLAVADVGELMALRSLGSAGLSVLQSTTPETKLDDCHEIVTVNRIQTGKN